MQKIKTRYTIGGTTDQNSVGMGYWTRINMDFQTDDIFIELNDATAHRPNLVTKQIYNKDNLVWLLLQYNKIIDPIAELVPGKVIRLPQPKRVI